MGKRFVASYATSAAKAPYVLRRGQDDKSRRSANPACVETLDAYLERLASGAAVPGGGSAAALVASFAAALTAMVARIARRSPKNAASTEALDAIVERADSLRAEISDARLRDEEAFTAVVAAQALPKDTEAAKAERRQAWTTPLRGPPKNPCARPG